MNPRPLSEACFRRRHRQRRDGQHAAGTRSAGTPARRARSIDLLRQRQSGLARSGRRPCRTTGSSRLFQGLALLPLRQLFLERNRLSGKHSGHPVAELAHQRVGDVVDGERMLPARPRRCGREKAPAATHLRVRRATRRRCRCAPRRTVRRSPPADSGAASRGSARFPTARRCAACPSSRRHRPAAHRGCGSGAAITRSPAANRACTAGWSGSDDSSTGRVVPGEHRARRGQRPRHRDRHLLGVLHIAGEQLDRPRPGPARGAGGRPGSPSSSLRLSSAIAVSRLAARSVISTSSCGSAIQCQHQIGHHLHQFEVADPRRADPAAGPRDRNLHRRRRRTVRRARIHPLEPHLGGIRQRQRREPQRRPPTVADTSVMPAARHSSRSRATATSRWAGSGSAP